MRSIVALTGILLFYSCNAPKDNSTASANATSLAASIVSQQTPLDQYVHTVDDAFDYEIHNTIVQDGYTLYIIRMVSQHWLTENEVQDPEWWHWLTLVVPDNIQSNKGMLFIGGGSRDRAAPDEANELLVQAALATQTVTADLHNVPNQPLTFKGDDYGPREEDEIIAYGWRKFMEQGGKAEDARWLARLPMTAAAVRAMDVITEVTATELDRVVDQFVVSGASKRGWTTWTTAAVDERVIAIAPIVIDLLNVVPSFQHHWQVYGFWAPAVGNYEQEGIMEWQGSVEYQNLLDITGPFAYRERYTMPKLILNATGDQFFIPDSWQFYWDELPGEKQLRYVPNSEHSMNGTDVGETLIAFYEHIITETPRPTFDWRIVDNQIIIEVNEAHLPRSITLWQATNPKARDFRVDQIGLAYKPIPLELTSEHTYTLSVSPPDEGYTAFFGELTFDGVGETPLKLSTGVVVVPDQYPHAPFESADPQGTQLRE